MAIKQTKLFPGRKKRSNAELRIASGHLYYEIEMLDRCTYLLARGQYKDRTVTNALLESFTIHARVLLDFLYATKSVRPDDVIAEDFFDSLTLWHQVRPKKTKLLSSIHKRVGKEVAHLTYARQKVTAQKKKWHFLKIWQDVLAVLRLFLDNVPESRLDKRLRRMRKSVTQYGNI